VRAELYDKDKNIVNITSEPVTFEAKATSGTVDVTFTFNAQSYKGENLVIYEYLYEGTVVDATKRVGDHTEFTDTKQTIYISPLYLTFDKTDYSDLSIAGAKFQLLDSTGTAVDEWTSDGTTKHISQVESYGKYTLVEVYAPNGYSLSPSIEVELRESDEKVYVDGVVKGEYTNDPLVINKDSPLTELPTAGGMGTMPFIIIGLMLMALPVYTIIKRKEEA
ncbi:VaFE repeat-containing surface-anchored protein, partial [bacterium]|nr:VaFE repeat-containing surface-anchored protein [bacterium]